MTPILLLATLASCGLVDSEEYLSPTGEAATNTGVDHELDSSRLELSCDPSEVARAIAMAIEGTADADGLPDPAEVIDLDAADGGLLGLECLTNLEELRLSGDLSDEDIGRLAALKKLTSIVWSEMTTIEALTRLPNLRRLTLGSDLLHELTPMQELEFLEELSLHGVFALDSLKPIGELRRLKLLRFFGVGLRDGRVLDYSFLENLALETLDLNLSDGVVDFSSVRSERLSRIALQGVSWIHLEQLGPPAGLAGSLILDMDTEGSNLELLVESLCPLNWCIETCCSSEETKPHRISHCNTGCTSDW